MSLYCGVCSKDFVQASARTKHESTCKDSPPSHDGLTKLVYKLSRKIDAMQKEINDLKRSRVGATVKDKPISFPEITETDFWEFLEKGLVHLVCSKDWPLYVDGKRFMIYTFCKESNEETWKEASVEELGTFANKIWKVLKEWFVKNMPKMESNKEGEGPEYHAPKLSTINSKTLREAFIASKEMFSD